MPFYQFGTQNHLRIWFSGKKDVFLNEENQLRMVRFREKNPRANVTFVYSSKMLSDETHEKLKSFCRRHHFTPLDFDTALLDECFNQVDKDLYQLAKTELDAYIRHEGGNLAAASDLTRFITPLLVKGTYSDFDTTIDVGSLQDIIEVKAPMLLDIGSVEVSHRFGAVSESPLINNDIIGVATKDGLIDPAARALLQEIQENLLKVYHEGASNTLKRLSKTTRVAAESPLIQYYNAGIFNLLFKERPDISITDFRLFLDKATKNIFNAFRLLTTEEIEQAKARLDEGLSEKLFSALSNIDHDNFPIDFSPKEQVLIKKAYINMMKIGLRDTIDALRSTEPQQAALVNISFQQIKEIDDPDECFRLLQLSVTASRTVFLRDSVTIFSGPLLLADTLLSKSPILFREVSFDWNHLFEHFHSGQSFKLGSSVEVFQDRMCKSVGTVCDISWLSTGQEAMQNREDKMQDAAKTIQRMWKRHVRNIEDQPPANPRDQEASPGKQ